MMKRTERVCAICGKPIERGQKWTEVDGKYYHWICYHAKASIEEIAKKARGIAKIKALIATKLIEAGIPKEKALEISSSVVKPLWEELHEAAVAGWDFRARLEELRIIADIPDIEPQDLIDKYREIESAVNRIADIGVNMDNIIDLLEELQISCRGKRRKKIISLVDTLLKVIEEEILRRL